MRSSKVPLEVLRFQSPECVLVGTYGGGQPVCAEPFDVIEIPAARLWGG